MAANVAIMAACFDLPQRGVWPLESAVLKQSAARPKSWVVFVVLMSVAVSLCSKFPAYTDPNAKFPGSFVAFPATPYGRAIAWWLEHPFQPVPLESFFPAETRNKPLLVGAASHCDKLTFRSFIPLLNQLTGGGVWTLVVANHLAAILAFFLLYRICLRVTADAVLATASTWAYAACGAGAWGFNDLVFGDAVAVALLLAAVATGRSWLVAALVLAAGFTDERAICAAPLIALFRHWESSRGEKSATPSGGSGWKTAAAPVLIGMLAYAGCRLGGAYVFKLHAGTSMMATVDILLYHFYVSYPVKLFGVFEFLWVYPVLLLFNLDALVGFGRRDLAIYGLCLLAAAAPAFVVWDVERSLCYLLPGILLSICFSAGASRERGRLAIAIFAASLLWMEPNRSLLFFFVS